MQPIMQLFLHLLSKLLVPLYSQDLPDRFGLIMVSRYFAARARACGGVPLGVVEPPRQTVRDVGVVVDDRP